MQKHQLICDSNRSKQKYFITCLKWTHTLAYFIVAENPNKYVLHYACCRQTLQLILQQWQLQVEILIACLLWAKHSNLFFQQQLQVKMFHSILLCTNTLAYNVPTTDPNDDVLQHGQSLQLILSQQQMQTKTFYTMLDVNKHSSLFCRKSRSKILF